MIPKGLPSKSITVQYSTCTFSLLPLPLSRVVDARPGYRLQSDIVDTSEDSLLKDLCNLRQQLHGSG